MTPKEARAMRPTPVAGQQCPVCKRVYLDETKAAACTKTCAWKAYLQDLRERREATRQAGMDYVRNNATSIEHAMKLMVEYCKGLGIKLTFEQYPKHFGDVSNSHRSPKGFPTNWGRNEGSIPSSYPGWSGNWVGTIKGKCPMRNCHRRGYNDIDTSCLFEHMVNGFHTGTGNPGGPKFQISGEVFIYDFPKMMTTGSLLAAILKASPKTQNLKAIEYATRMSDLMQDVAANPKKKKIDNILISPILYLENSW